MFKRSSFLLTLLLIVFLTEGVPKALAQGPSPTPTPVTSQLPPSNSDSFSGFKQAVEDLGKTFDALKNLPQEFQKFFEDGFKGGFKVALDLFFSQWADALFGYPFLDFSNPNSLEVGLAKNASKLFVLFGTIILVSSLAIKIIRFGRGDDVGDPNNLVWHGIWTVVILLLSAGLPYFLNQFFSGANKLIADTLHGELPFLPHTDSIESLKNLVFGIFGTPNFLWIILVVVVVVTVPKIIVRLITAKIVVVLGAIFGLGIAGISVVREKNQITARKTLETFLRHFLELLFFAILLALLVSLSTAKELISISAWMLFASLLILQQAPFQLAQATINLLRLNSASDEEQTTELMEQEDGELTDDNDPGADSGTKPKAYTRL